MVRAKFSLVLALLVLHVSLESPACESTKIRRQYSAEKPRTSLFIFGDSFFDPGNNNYINTTTLDQANFQPYGESFFGGPTGRFSDGRLISDFVAEFANLPFIPPFLQPGFRNYDNGVNFASAGAGALVETFQGSVIDLKAQLRNYKSVKGALRHKLGRFGSHVTLTKAVYFFCIGTNDYLSLFLTNSTILNHYSKSQYVDMVIGNLTAVIKEIHTIGGRKFGFMNLPNFGCSPGIRVNNNGSCSKEASKFVKLHNKAFSKVVTKLEQELEGFKYSVFDFEANLRHIINHPSRYGFKEEKTACCGTGKFRGVFSCGGKRIVKEFEVCEDPKKHVFWDSFHLTEIAYKQLADQIWIGTGYYSLGIKPYNLKDLFQSTNF